jgi:hypothetical protein
MASPLGLTFDTTSNSTKIGTYKVVDSKAVKSVFAGGGQFSPYPSSVNTESGSVTSIRNASDIHNDDMNDTSISSLVNYTRSYPSMKLDYADFAYLKDVGVYPNNRLIIARRFPAGVSNDLTSIKSSPMSTLISWVKDGDDFISVNYSEDWVDAPASFEDVLNQIGEDVKSSKDNNMGNLGGAAAAAFNAIPFPGFMEGIQYQVMKNMGLTDAGIGNSPLGNPNLIREAKMRKTLGKGESGAGLKASFSIKMTVEYEQKFINGVDPTLVYMDIIQNALTFGTSDSAFQFSSAFGQGVTGIIKDLISGDIGAIASAIQKFVTSLLDAIATVGKQIIDALVDPPKDDQKPSSGQIFDAVKKAFAATIGHVISKYKIKLIGISNALTGSNSTPWHVTIGNPKKPIFSSGDMLCKEVSLTVGKNLAFNDLPSYIKIEFTLENARNLGAQEVFNRFNTGKGRSYVRLNKSFVESPDITFATASETTTMVGTQSVTKNEVTPTTSPQKPDDYLISGSDGPSYLNYGTPKSSVTPPSGDSTTAQTTNDTTNKPSNQSTSSQQGSVSAVPPQSSTTTPEPGSQPLVSQDVLAYNATAPGGVITTPNTEKIEKATDQELSDREAYLKNNLRSTDPLINNTFPNPKYTDMVQELNFIHSEQKNRA